MTPTTDEQLPELPSSYGDIHIVDSVRTMREAGFTADQMRAYAHEAIAAVVAERDRILTKMENQQKYIRKMDGIIEEVGGVTASCINPYEDLKAALLGQKGRAEKAEAERDALRADSVKIECIEINDAPKLDQINVFLQDLDPGRGRITIECYGLAWSAYFGGLGDRTIKRFVSKCDAEYLSGKLKTDRMTKVNRAYLYRITQAVIDHVNAAMKGVGR